MPPSAVTSACFRPPLASSAARMFCVPSRLIPPTDTSLLPMMPTKITSQALYGFEERAECESPKQTSNLSVFPYLAQNVFCALLGRRRALYKNQRFLPSFFEVNTSFLHHSKFYPSLL